uniref:Rpn family recombination-promoting nuclease/putative transposase n=1 Tax=Caldicellulosiruptor owensensis TaxID=55205 RepID=A0A7C5Z0T8_9FIRM
MSNQLPHNINDLEYKYIFSNKSIFLRFLKRLDEIGVFKNLTEEQLERIDKSYVLPDFSEQESDILYKVNLKEKEIIFYILVEHQSTVDHSMSIRLLFYITDIYRDYIKDFDKGEIKKKGFRLPAVVPIVFYDGEDRWTATRRLKEKILGFEEFGNCVIDFEYILIDLNQAESILQVKDILSLILKLNRIKRYEELESLFLELREYLCGAEEKEIEVLKVCLPVALRELEEIEVEAAKRAIDESLRGGEKVMPLFQNLRKIREELIFEGLQQGLQQGFEKSKIETAERMILKGYKDEEIAEITGLSLEKVKELRAKHRN